MPGQVDFFNYLLLQAPASADAGEKCALKDGDNFDLQADACKIPALEPSASTAANGARPNMMTDAMQEDSVSTGHDHAHEISPAAVLEYAHQESEDEEEEEEEKLGPPRVDQDNGYSRTREGNDELLQLLRRPLVIRSGGALTVRRSSTLPPQPLPIPVPVLVPAPARVRSKTHIRAHTFITAAAAPPTMPSRPPVMVHPLVNDELYRVFKVMCLAVLLLYIPQTLNSVGTRLAQSFHAYHMLGLQAGRAFAGAGSDSSMDAIAMWRWDEASLPSSSLIRSSEGGDEDKATPQDGTTSTAHQGKQRSQQGNGSLAIHGHRRGLLQHQRLATLAEAYSFVPVPARASALVSRATVRSVRAPGMAVLTRRISHGERVDDAEEGGVHELAVPSWPRAHFLRPGSASIGPHSGYNSPAFGHAHLPLPPSWALVQGGASRAAAHHVRDNIICGDAKGNAFGLWEVAQGDGEGDGEGDAGSGQGYGPRPLAPSHGSQRLARGLLPDLPRQSAVKAMFVHAWTGYKDAAWGADQLKPVSRTGENPLGGLGASLVDSLDTLLLMGLHVEFVEAEKVVLDKVRLIEQEDVNLFETTIRVLGGLLSAWELTSRTRPALLGKAVHVADSLLFGFDSPSGIPYGTLGCRSRRKYNPAWVGGSTVAEVATLQLEWEHLSAATGDPKYALAARRVTAAMMTSEPIYDSLWPTFLNPEDGSWNSQHVTLGARGDSTYEYLLKVPLLSGAGRRVRGGSWATMHDMHEVERGVGGRKARCKDGGGPSVTPVWGAGQGDTCIVGMEAQVGGDSGGNSSGEAPLPPSLRIVQYHGPVGNPAMLGGQGGDSATPVAAWQAGPDFALDLDGMAARASDQLDRIPTTPSTPVMVGGYAPPHGTHAGRAWTAAGEVDAQARYGLYEGDAGSSPASEAAWFTAVLGTFWRSTAGIMHQLVRLSGADKGALDKGQGKGEAPPGSGGGLGSVFDLSIESSPAWAEGGGAADSGPTGRYFFLADRQGSSEAKEVADPSGVPTVALHYPATQWDTKQDHLACFTPGLMALASTVAPTASLSRRALGLAKTLMRTCMRTYTSTATKLAPEIVRFNSGEPGSGVSGEPFTDGTSRHSLLRPEAVESLLILFRVTGDSTYREWGWMIAEALNATARVQTGGFASVKDVHVTRSHESSTAHLMDTQETFFLAETMKYLYLLFGPSEDLPEGGGAAAGMMLPMASTALPLDEWVFNTEAHPLPIWRGRVEAWRP